MKGIVLAGGSGNRLYPMTRTQTKQLQPIYDKPMIYYPLSILMLCNIREILLITTESDLPLFKRLLGDGSDIGISIQYMAQAAPNGIAEAFLLGEKFIGNDNVTLILGDNLFYGNLEDFRIAIKNQCDNTNNKKARVFAYSVSDPERYGIVEFDKKTRSVLSIEEKPKRPKSNFAIPGFYIFDNTVTARVKNQKPSARNELEITDLIDSYLRDGLLGVELINRGMAWFDTGTPQSLLEASSFIGAIEHRQGLKVACLEEIALRLKFIDNAGFQAIIDKIPCSTYKSYLEIVQSEIMDEA